MDSPAITSSTIQQQSFVARVYAWMCAALVVSAVVALIVASNSAIASAVLENSFLFLGILIGELLLVGYLSLAIKKMSASTASIVFFGYAALNGVTFSLIFLAYTASSIALTFFATASLFGAMSIYGFTTKKDLTSLGSLFFMGLLGLILATVINLFLNNSVIYWITTYAGILIFTGLTAYDAQKIKQMNKAGTSSEDSKKQAIIASLALYLDFINLFLLLIRITGRQR